MKNWKTLAEAYSLGIPESGLDLITAPLDGLEQSFRKLATSFPADTDSAQIFEAWPEAE